MESIDAIDGGRPMLIPVLNRELGRSCEKIVIAIEKKTAMLIVCAMLLNVVRIPLPAPRCSGAREFIIAVSLSRNSV